MKKGWIKMEDEFPPIGVDIIVSFPNPVYGGHIENGPAKRVNNHIACGNVTLEMNQDSMFRATHWAYNNGQKLPYKCDCYFCNPNKGKELIDARLNEAKEYSISQNEENPDKFIKWIKRNCGYNHGILFLNDYDTMMFTGTPDDEELYKLYKSNHGRLEDFKSK